VGIQVVIRNRFAFIATAAGTTDGTLFITATAPQLETITQTILVTVR
jgi:hypothetical protein